MWNAICPQCGSEFYKGRDDVGTLCDRCCAERDLFAAEDERERKRMAKAALPRKVRTV